MSGAFIRIAAQPSTRDQRLGLRGFNTSGS
jgi:hypothetical protein